MKSINLTIPLYNEELVLSENVVKILDFLNYSGMDKTCNWQIILANNSSTDKTEAIAKIFAHQFPQKVFYLYLPQKGKGLAIKTAWEKFPADYYIFMDADLATDLEALPRLVAALEDDANLVIGSRYLPESKTERSILRILISKIYRSLARLWLNIPFTDLACGFKGADRKIINQILPMVKNKEWFFDTELVYRCRLAGFKIKEIPVKWTETLNQKRKSRVGIINVGWNYLKEITRLKLLP